MRFAAAVILAALTAAKPALAECTNTDPDPGSVQAATVAGGDPRVFFVRDALGVPGCPNASAGCRAKAYVMKGDVVVTTVTQGPYTCATYSNGRGNSTTYWLPTASLVPITTPATDWIGNWVRIEAEISITHRDKGGGLSLHGSATWGAFDPERVKRGGVNLGAFDAVVQPAGGRAAFTESGDATLPFDQGNEFDCRVELALVGPYLVARDNNNCGGHNVSFSGVYRRKG